MPAGRTSCHRELLRCNPQPLPVRTEKTDRPLAVVQDCREPGGVTLAVSHAGNRITVTSEPAHLATFLRSGTPRSPVEVNHNRGFSRRLQGEIEVQLERDIVHPAEDDIPVDHLVLIAFNRGISRAGRICNHLRQCQHKTDQPYSNGHHLKGQFFRKISLFTTRRTSSRRRLSLVANSAVILSTTPRSIASSLRPVA